MARLDTLVEDLLLVIGSELERRDNMQLRVACRAFSIIFAPRALSELSIKFNNINYSMEAEKLEAYAQRTTAGADYVRKLSILSLAHTAEPGMLGTVVEYGVSPEQTAFQRDEQLKKLLSQALRAMDIRTLQWHPNARDPTWAFDVVSKYLVFHPVPELYIDFGRSCPRGEVALGGFGGISKLSIKHMRETHLNLYESQVAALRSGLAQVIAASPGLEELTVMESSFPSFGRGQGGPLILQEFLPEKGATPLRLRSLTMHVESVVLTDQNLPNLRYLESLDMVFYKWMASHFAGVWKKLRMCGIKLKKVRTSIEHVDEELLQYLEYCDDTLTELILDDVRNREIRGVDLPLPEIQEECANQFYSMILPRLAANIQRLHICTKEVNAWCYSTSNYLVFEDLMQIRELTVSIVDLNKSHSMKTQFEQLKTILPEDALVNAIEVHRPPQFWW